MELSLDCVRMRRDFGTERLRGEGRAVVVSGKKRGEKEKTTRVTDRKAKNGAPGSPCGRDRQVQREPGGGRAWISSFEERAT